MSIPLIFFQLITHKLFLWSHKMSICDKTFTSWNLQRQFVLTLLNDRHLTSYRKGQMQIRILEYIACQI